ncbi:DUF2000 domain-containing protein [Salmonella enterica subsp. enterica serovar Newport]|uniref:DUF2000 domain-containing protein n=1 Tax=Salmonella enterica TaxID=28901 RepID=A0A742UE46_SALER|nr:DUF2000 domain-containing protein [Salmonella enterica]EBV6066501.1 DUF2000 domain-containing protein [Salmonella enterica subsp. enterica serovar Thompson]ECJ2364195.1 DUF2000 domain-containing protein [Salmonella enterica subsp. diarizonae]ECK9473064.1 DUF2000 domain-containing protein [Salmonella enterica subsp. enterica serovar Dublin str. CFSAN000518]EII7447381.1 DUF2000 domain-containing protein [Salmonella enterica subsp. enterica serovar Newport]HAE8376754.1 DUF2000 domain-containin
MKFDANQHRCTIIINKDLPAGLAINAASVIGISFGRTVENLVGPDMQSLDKVNYPGVIYSPLPVLLASGEYIREIQINAEIDSEIYVMPFSGLAQSCRTYEEYGEKISSVNCNSIELVAIGIIGPKKKVTQMTGNLALYK